MNPSAAPILYWPDLGRKSIGPKRTKEIAVVLGLALAVSIVAMTAHASEVIGKRPRGCPHAYCGCGLSLHIFGRIVPELNLAWNWARRFPRTHAYPGAVAVRRHHVMQLVRQVEGSRWIVRDYNGARHLSWIHARDVRGYVFVDAAGGFFAAAQQHEGL